ncbi:MAG: bifunctional folylpolyglutamate synthase/dihydrofolate synthase [Fibrobacter sp.]|nr:bifunctional folylpolyglutamate synthase/dihydrofolate synthase [Fibrobacter sp.]
MMQNAGMEYLNSRLMFGMAPGLKSTRLLCEALGNPQEKFKSIHVVGTNGKGSTSYYLAGILKGFGFRTALYTSPHLVNLRERIRIDDEPIAEADLNRYLLQVKVAAEQVNQRNVEKIEPTFFEVLTLVAFLHYANSGVEVAVLEAGMGGRLDSTAVADGSVAIVTSVGLEHTEILGATESAILREKMAVVGEDASRAAGKVFVLGGLPQPLLEEALEYASRLGARAFVPEIRDDIQLPNLGRHYVENASLSLAAAKIICDSFSAMKGGAAYRDDVALQSLATRSWAGRMQILSDSSGKCRFILDGAHNSHAVRRLVQSLDKYYPGKKFHCVFGALKDKDVDEMLKLMAPYVSHWHITRTDYARFRELDDLRNQLHDIGLMVASEGVLGRSFLDSVRDAADDNLPVLVTGSLYMIGECIQALKQDFEGLSFFRGLAPTTNEHR